MPRPFPSARSLPRIGASGAAPLLLLAGSAAATYSVVRYRLWIVVLYTALTLVLGLVLATRGGRLGRGGLSTAGTPLPPRSVGPLASRGVAAVALLLTAVTTLCVPAFTYLQGTDAQAVRRGTAAAALLAGLLVLVPGVPLPRRSGSRHDGAPRRVAGHDLALAVALVTYTVVAVTLIRLDPAPRIDVWVTLQQASDALWRGDNIYATNWSGSPGVQDAFTYLPWMAVLLSPGRLLCGDVRWTLVAVGLATAVAVRLLARSSRTGDADAATSLRPGGDDRAQEPDVPPGQPRAAATAAILLLLLPGTSTQVEQAWTEPVLAACLAGWALAMTRNRPWVAVVFLALGLASKQHLVLLLPLLAAWPRFGWRRTLTAAGAAAVLVLPWFVVSPADMWHDTVDLLVHFPPIRFADTLYLASIKELGWTPPFALTATLVLGVVAAATLAVHRRVPDLREVLTWCALVLLVANLVNKQAFYNQYWLVMALVLLSWAVPVPSAPPPVARPVVSRGSAHAHPVRP